MKMPLTFLSSVAEATPLNKDSAFFMADSIWEQNMVEKTISILTEQNPMPHDSETACRSRRGACMALLFAGSP